MIRRRRQPRPLPAPWSPDEDAKLADMVNLGVTTEAWPVQFPARRFGEVLERRLELIEAGRCQHPPLL